VKLFYTYRILNRRFSGLSSKRRLIRLALILFLIQANWFNGIAQFSYTGSKPAMGNSQSINKASDPNDIEYDEIMILLNVPRIGSVEIPALIIGETAFLPVKDLFDFLKIRNLPAADLCSIEGFFIEQGAVYSINNSKHQITYQNRIFELQPSDMICNESGLFLRTALFGKVFGLDCEFSFRSLSVKLNTTIELPALRDMKMEAMHKNLIQLKGDRKADTTITRKFSLFKLGVFDWSVNAIGESFNKQNTRFTLGIGAIVAGGETNLFLNYNKSRPFSMKDQYYFWRYVNNESKIVRQITAGKILANPVSTISDGIVGIQINNMPTTFRKSFGTYALSNKTEPGWLVELYVNDVLLNYTHADASGFFTFEVPIFYGNSNVKLRYYGPWGEEQSIDQNLAIPFNFLPQHHLEYNVSAGIVEDNEKSRFSRTQVNYGVSNRFTIGCGMEYLSSVSDKVMPFLKFSYRVGSGLLITGEHINKVRTSGLISFRFPSNLKIEMNYLRYEKDQKAIRVNYLEEKKLIISRPFHGSNYSLFARLTVNQFRQSNYFKQLNYTSTELLISSLAYGISSNLLNYLLINKSGIPLAYSNLSLTFRLPHGINLLPQAEFEYNRGKFRFIKAEAEKSVFKRGFLNISYQWDLKINDYIAGLGFRYNFSFASTSMSVKKSRSNAIYTEMARGSLLYDRKTNLVSLNNLNNIGRSGLIIAAYLDINGNGKREADEPAAPGLKMKISGGRILNNIKDTTLVVSGLDAYTDYFIELDKNSFENISWQLKQTTFRISLDPNHFTYLQIPVTAMGEVSGTVYLDGNKGSNGLGRIVVNIYNSDAIQVARMLTESDGYFNYLGLRPGYYSIRIDEEQLLKLNMVNTSGNFQVEIQKNKDGDTKGNIVFILKKK